MGLKKRGTLRLLFCKFAVSLIVLLLAAIVIPFCMISFFINMGWATSANQSELEVKALIPTLTVAPDITKVVMPQGCEYLILDKDFQELFSNMDGREKEDALQYAKGEYVEQGTKRQFVLVVRENELCVLQYYIGSQFTVSWLPEYFPSPDILMFTLMIVNAMVVIIILTTRFAKKLRIQLTPLLEATKEVAEQNLDFEMGHSTIKEFEDVLVSFSDMKDNLKSSLEKQWKVEQAQKEQIAALAHDLKTPLTVIQGNIDLINETELDEEQKLYADYITNSSEQMQSYIKVMIEISKAAVGVDMQKVTVDSAEMMEQIAQQVKSLGNVKGIGVQTDIQITSRKMEIDRMMLERAIMNIVDNAIDYSPKGGTIYLTVKDKENRLQIVIADEGPGFSQDALQHAQERFFMDDRSRGSELHMGMGLYIASSVMRQNGGQMFLENDAVTHGAKVRMELPMKEA